MICRFEDFVGKYPYHCHILEHEEHEMMRQFQVLQQTGVAPEAMTRGTRLGQSVPNPTTGVARITFALSARAAAAGRRIATLVDQVFTAGDHEVLWNGRLANGEMARSGVYFYRLMVDGKLATTRRLVVLR